jgi:L-lactate dehydrogenase (cytochrome)
MAATAPAQQTGEAKAPLTREEVAKHNTPEDCWVVLNGYAYDMTDFLEDHPGGEGIILKYAGRDASKTFNPIHPKDMVDSLDEDAHKGPVTPFELPAGYQKMTVTMRKKTMVKRSLTYLKW